MLNDTEVPTAPLQWAARVHGDLVLVDRVQADAWEPFEEGATPEGATVLVEGVLSTVSRGSGTSLMLETDAASKTGLVTVGDDTILVVTHIGGEGGPDLRVAAQDVPDDAYTATGATFTAGFVGVVLFDGSSTWEMASEQMLYAFAEVKKGDYAVSVSGERETDSGKKLRVVRLKRS